jgi:hypothetical protein
MLVYYFADHDHWASETNQSYYFYTGKTAAEKGRREFARDTFETKTERDYWLNEHPVMVFELKGKDMIVDYLNQAAGLGYIEERFNAERV